MYSRVLCQAAGPRICQTFHASSSPSHCIHQRALLWCATSQHHKHFSSSPHRHSHTTTHRLLHSRSSLSPLLSKWSPQQHLPLLSTAALVRHQSSDSAAPAAASDTAQNVASNLPAGYIPEPPTPTSTGADDLASSAEAIASLAEPALKTLGLCNNTPAGFYQMALEFIHCTGGMPWWLAIGVSTLMFRLAIFPLMIRGQRSAANMSNHMPTVQRMQADFTKARAAGDQMEALRVGNELQSYMKRNEIQPFKAMMLPLAQMPIFLSVFYGLRGMANLPVQSMTTGGLAWFTDLTVPDPYYILPLVTCATLFVVFEIGAESMRTSAMAPGLRMFMRCMPLVMLPIMINFPAAMLCYWCTSNGFSLFQALLLRNPALREKLKIPARVEHDKAKLAAVKKKGFFQGFKENYSNTKLIAEIENRRKVDAMRFKEAGIAPVKKTYSYDPTKVKNADKS